MANIRGCDLPDTLYYFLDGHTWAKPLGNGLLRVGLTAVARALTGGRVASLAVLANKIGRVVAQGEPIAELTGGRHPGPVPAPASGVLVLTNARLATDPSLVVADPYGEGWLAEIDPTRWEAERAGLANGPEGMAAYRARLEAEGISC